MDESLHPIEKKVLLFLGAANAPAGLKEIEQQTGLKDVEAMRAIQWLESKDYVNVAREEVEFVTLLDFKFKFAEREAIQDVVKKPKPVAKVDKVALTWLMKRRWAKIEKGNVQATPDGKKAAKAQASDETLFAFLKENKQVPLVELSDAQLDALKLLKKRPNVVKVEKKVGKEVSLTKAGQALAEAGLEIEDETSKLDKSMISSGKWKKVKLRKYDLKAPVPKVFPGKKHPMRIMIDKIRNIFLEMGFTEGKGPLVESAFWNFDALFQPQDHPARELADTFYLSKPAMIELPDKFVDEVKKVHENGGNTGSTGWGYKWDPEVAKQAILRTHTTSVSARHLSKVQPPAKIFCVGRVFRNETIDYKHLAEFHQVEGIVVDENASFKDLLGYLKEFYNRMGFEKIRFRPAYFPYTEMSVEPEVWFEEKGEWIELGGAGIFRPEVTEPFGIKCPVLAWGLGLERPIMLKLGLKDLRTFYQNDLGWLRNAPQI